jgi:hypothetical protein
VLLERCWDKSGKGVLSLLHGDIQISLACVLVAPLFPFLITFTLQMFAEFFLMPRALSDKAYADSIIGYKRY